MMISKKQNAANRRNAQKSTGPRTKAGKAKSALNATKHGVLSRVGIAEHEDANVFEALLSNLRKEHDPQTQLEVQLVERLALLFWREIRLAQAEAFQSKANKLNADHHDQDYFPDRNPEYFQAQEGIIPIETQLLIGRYQTMLTNQIAQTLSQLRHEQKLRTETIDLEPTKI